MNTDLLNVIIGFLLGRIDQIIKIFSEPISKIIETCRKRKSEIRNGITECTANVQRISDLRELYILVGPDENIETMNIVRDAFKRNKIKTDKIKKLLYPDYQITKNKEIKEKIIKNIIAILDKGRSINKYLDKCYKEKNRNHYHYLKVLTGVGKYEKDFDKQINNLKKLLEEIY